MRDQVKGFWALLFACVVWGLSGLYYKQLAAVPPLEVLAHRTLWSLVFFGAVLTVQGRLGIVLLALRGRNLLILLVSAVMISTNWFGFIWSVQNGRALEASLGYYIFPLVAVGLGVIVMRETMTRAQTLAVLIAACAVLYLTWGIGAPPWIALMLAGTFGAYGLIKKRLDVGPWSRLRPRSSCWHRWRWRCFLGCISGGQGRSRDRGRLARTGARAFCWRFQAC